jgi:LuxR family maltose regulon positive regulatory protein
MRQALEALLATADAGNRDTPPKDGKSRNADSFSRSYVLRLLAVFKQEEQARASFVDRPKVPPESRALVGVQGGSEPLSRQERRVLQHLVAGQTYAEMAEALIVSVNTIKTQVSSIYRKLGVSRRAEAIAKTAQLHLLSPLDRV